MKTVILAGGLGTRIAEESGSRPKPMLEVGGKPILWHIMKIYSTYGIREFIICLGYKGYVIKEYFANYFLHMSDVTFDMDLNRMEVHQHYVEPWKVTLVDTGEHSQTGGRLKRVAEYLRGEPDFCFTYGDGLADLDISDLVSFHRRHGKTATMTAVQPPGRFGAVDLEAGRVLRFTEKPSGESGAWINGGFFVLNREVLDLIACDSTVWESDVLTKLSSEDRLMAYAHRGFWQPMDTLREKNILEALWSAGQAPWKKWA